MMGQLIDIKLKLLSPLLCLWYKAFHFNTKHSIWALVQRLQTWESRYEFRDVLTFPPPPLPRNPKQHFHNALNSPFCPPSIDQPKPAFRAEQIGQRVQSSHFKSPNPTPLTCTGPKVQTQMTFIIYFYFLLKSPIILCFI